MTIPIPDFIWLLNGARMLAMDWPKLAQESVIWEHWKFDDRGAHYIERDNYGENLDCSGLRRGRTRTKGGSCCNRAIRKKRNS